jgi:hypothetical protein
MEQDVCIDVPQLLQIFRRNNQQDATLIEFIIPPFIEGSTCFERHAAHYQEL